MGRRPSGNISGFIPTARIHVPSGVRSAASAIRATRSAIEATPGIAGIDRSQLGAGEGEVVMGVDEAGQDRSALDVDLLGIGRRHHAQRRRTADGHDPVTDDRHATGERRFTGRAR